MPISGCHGVFLVEPNHLGCKLISVNCYDSCMFGLQVIIECNKAEDWLKEKKRYQEELPKSTNPTLLSAEVKRRTETLDR
jgi:hypothetical protein